MTRDMNAIVELAAELFHEHRRGHYGFKPWGEADAAQKNHARAVMLRTAKHALAAADELKPRTITTVEELDALPVGTRLAGKEYIHQKVSTMSFRGVAWLNVSHDVLEEAKHVPLPATVLNEPKQ